jgi:hypothetical protein
MGEMTERMGSNVMTNTIDYTDGAVRLEQAVLSALAIVSVIAIVSISSSLIDSNMALA